MSSIILVAVLQAGVFHAPPAGAPDFRAWYGRSWQNPADEPARMSVPPDIGFRQYLNSLGLCADSDTECQVRLHYHLTINRSDPDDASMAVLQYVIVGPNDARSQGFVWMMLDRTVQQYFILQDDGWQVLPVNETEVPQRRMADTLIRRGLRYFKDRPP